MIRVGLLLTLTATLVSSTALAQPQKPRSPRGTAETQVGGKAVEQKGPGGLKYEGGKWIEIDYGRPIKRQRENLFGKGADYGKDVNAGGPVWRAGANATTRLKTEAALEIGGKKLPPGEYSMFVDLKDGNWTLILSNQRAADKYDPKEKTATWGAYNYDPKSDVLRAPMKAYKPDHSFDELTIAFLDVTQDAGKIAIIWDREGAMIDFKVAK